MKRIKKLRNIDENLNFFFRNYSDRDIEIFFTKGREAILNGDIRYDTNTGEVDYLNQDDPQIIEKSLVCEWLINKIELGMLENEAQEKEQQGERNYE